MKCPRPGTLFARSIVVGPSWLISSLWWPCPSVGTFCVCSKMYKIRRYLPNFALPPPSPPPPHHICPSHKIAGGRQKRTKSEDEECWGKRERGEGERGGRKGIFGHNIRNWLSKGKFTTYGRGGEGDKKRMKKEERRRRKREEEGMRTKEEEGRGRGRVTRTRRGGGRVVGVPDLLPNSNPQTPPGG